MMENITMTEFTTLPSNVYAPDNVSWQTHAEELKAQLDAVRGLKSYDVTFVDKNTFLRITRNVIDSDELQAILEDK